MKHKLKPIVYFILAILLLIGYYTREDENVFGERNENLLSLYFIDVGQADSAFFAFPSGETLLIDAGNKEDGQKVVDFIKDLGFDKIDYVIATHPHEDHIGGMSEVLEVFKVGKFYMPDATNTTIYYEDMLDVLIEKEIDFEIAKAGLLIKDGEETIEILSPRQKKYEDLNHYSIVSKITYKDTSFLITGDAEAINEREMIKTFGGKLKSDILKVGHHGSSTSSTEDFIKLVAPKTAVISVGKDNDYGHPHRETKETLKKAGIEVLRTDEVGSILIESDGKNLNIVTERSGE